MNLFRAVVWQPVIKSFFSLLNHVEILLFLVEPLTRPQERPFLDV
jgi:hypothetical protein